LCEIKRALIDCDAGLTVVVWNFRGEAKATPILNLRYATVSWEDFIICWLD